MARNFASASSQYGETTGTPVTAYPVTMACWFYPVADSVDYTAMSATFAAGTSQELVMRLQGAAAGNPVLALRNNGASVASTTGYSAGAWFHGCVMWSASNTAAAYINGGSKGTGSTSATVSANCSGACRVGRRGTTATGYMNGRIAEAGIWNVELNDNEVAYLAAGVSPLRVRPESLVAYWPLKGLSSPEPDWRSATGATRYDLTLINTPTAVNHPPVQPFSRRYWTTWPTEITAAAAGGGMPFDGLTLGGRIFGRRVIG